MARYRCLWVNSDTDTEFEFLLLIKGPAKFGILALPGDSGNLQRVRADFEDLRVRFLVISPPFDPKVLYISVSVNFANMSGLGLNIMYFTSDSYLEITILRRCNKFSGCHGEP